MNPRGMIALAYGSSELRPSRSFSSTWSRMISSFSQSKAPPLDKLVLKNPQLSEALEKFRTNDIESAMRIALDQYKLEFASSDPRFLLTFSRASDTVNRPAYTFLSEILASLGPRNSLAISAIAEMHSVGEESSPFKPRVIRRQHGGYPVRLNNGKWTWQGPHWSRRNNRTWKTGYSSDFTNGWDLFALDLPSDSESDDSDYVTENEGASSSSEEERMDDEKPSRSFKKEIQRKKINTVYDSLMRAADEKVSAEDHSDVLIDPLMLEFQRAQPKSQRDASIATIEQEVEKYSNITKSDNQIDVKRYKQLARGTAATVDRASVDRALQGMVHAKVEIEEEMRFAGEIVKTKKLVERTSSHAARFERRKRASEEQAASLGGGSLGSFQTYLNQIKSHKGISSVEKSASDWNQLKMNTEGMDQALQVDRGYIEKQAFLIRSGAKEDELRREARRKKLMESAASLG